MREEKVYTEATEDFKPFPEPEEVFAADVEQHRRHLVPLASFRADRAHEGLPGWLHFVTPIEPWDGCVGEDTEEHHSEFCGENWIAYRVVDGRYRFEADWRYFLINTPPETIKDRGLRSTREELDGHYEEVEKNFAERAKHFREHANLGGLWGELGTLGGLPWYGNWCGSGFSEIPQAEYEATNEDGEEAWYHVPKTADGREYLYIGQVYQGDYGLPSCFLMLFYDPQESIVLTTFDWS